MNSYQDFVQTFARALAEARRLPLGGFPKPADPTLPAQTPKVLLFSPHPDDEVIIGGLALRLRRELRMRVVNVAVTQGSNKARQAERLKELKACCQHINFDVMAIGQNGLEGVNLKTRQNRPADWTKAVDQLAGILKEQNPRVILFPHDDDWNSTHIGTHHLVMDALARQDQTFHCLAVETEFWGAMKSPNLMVETSSTDLVDLLMALTFHVGEVNRNPYHLRLPAWLIDNVRRGGELVGGQGGAAPDFTFATLYRLRRWRAGQLEAVFAGGKFVSQTESLAELFVTAP
jgi:LmbE family N-acetylglucosaminyl deacetylase